MSETSSIESTRNPVTRWTEVSAGCDYHNRTLPEGCALVETCDGRWFPALAPQALRLAVFVGEPIIPPALEPLDDPRYGYRSRQEAMEAYDTWREAATLPRAWQRLSAHTELYPERNAWYLDQV